jgi:hypothetical protein
LSAEADAACKRDSLHICSLPFASPRATKATPLLLLLLFVLLSGSF